MISSSPRQLPPLMIGQNKKRCISLLASDASASSFGFYIDGRLIGGDFSTQDKARPIAEKEALALSKLIKHTVQPSCDYSFFCDNSVAVAAFSKGRSSNPFISRLVGETRIHLNSINSRIRVVWASTLTMKSLADPPSRGQFNLDPFGLSGGGVSHLYRLQPAVRIRKNNDDLISLFGSPRNNPLQVAYCSLDFDLNDPLCKRRDAFSLLEARVAKKKQLEGGVLAFPPPMLTGPLADYIARMGLGRDTQVFMIIPASQVLSVKNKLGGLVNIQIQRFCASKNKSVFHRIPGRDMSLVTLSSFDIEVARDQRAEAGVSGSGSKRPFDSISSS